MGSYYHLSYSGKKGLKYYFKRSFILHFVLVLILFFTANIHGLLSPFNRVNVKIIESSVRVDVVAMPTKTFKELKSIDMRPAPSNPAEIIKVDPQDKVKAEVSDKDAFLKKKKKVSFQEMMKQMAQKKLQKNTKKTKKKSVTKNNRNSKVKISDRQKSELRNLILAGNKISKGTATTGSKNSGDTTEFHLYLGRLPGHVKPNWKLPSYLFEKGLTCRVRIFLTPSGQLVKAEVFETSGEEEYDKKALEAVYASAPFPELDGEFKQRGRKGEIILGFPL